MRPRPFLLLIAGVVLAWSMDVSADTPVDINWHSNYDKDDDSNQDVSVVAVDGQYIYLNFGRDFGIIDVSDPGNPQPVGFLEANGINDIEILGDFAFVAAGEEGLLVLDISDPTNPVQVGSFDGDDDDDDQQYSARRVELVGNFAFIVEREGFRVLNISDPTDLQTMGYSEIDDVKSMAITGDYAFVGGDGQIVVMDFSDLSDISQVGSYGDVFNVIDTEDLLVSGNHLLVAGGADGLLSFDISDPTQPQLESQWNDNGYAKRLVIDGGYVYVSNSDTVLMFDVSEPVNISQEIGIYEIDTPEIHQSGSSTGIDASGPYIYIANGKVGTTVLKYNFKPVATIDAISPDPAEFGEEISFSGSATDAEGGFTIFWESSIDGYLSIDSHFTVSNLSSGTHVISLRVTDTDGFASTDTTAIVVNKEPPVDDDDDILGIDPLYVVGALAVLAAAGGAYFYMQRDTAGQQPAPQFKPKTVLTAIECPGCNAQMKVPKLGKMQTVTCDSCGLSGEIEV